MIVVMGVSGNNSSLPKNFEVVKWWSAGGGECEEFFAIEEIEVVIEDIGDEIVVHGTTVRVISPQKNPGNQT